MNPTPDKSNLIEIYGDGFDTKLVSYFYGPEGQLKIVLGLNWKCAIDNPPDEGEHVLVYDEAEGICRGFLREGQWNHYPLSCNGSDACLFYVTHWVKLPNGPK